MMQNSQAAPVTGAKASAKGKIKVLTLVSKSEDAQHSRKKALKLTVGNTLFFPQNPWSIWTDIVVITTNNLESKVPALLRAK